MRLQGERRPTVTSAESRHESPPGASAPRERWNPRDAGLWGQPDASRVTAVTLGPTRRGNNEQFAGRTWCSRPLNTAQPKAVARAGKVSLTLRARRCHWSNRRSRAEFQGFRGFWARGTEPSQGGSAGRCTGRLCSNCARTIGHHRSQTVPSDTIGLTDGGRWWPVVPDGAL